MCGINGFNWDDKEIINKMNFAVKHRGPDNNGVYLDEGISLGHRRLSIIDLSSKGNQPIPNENQTVFLVFNGEIYNYKVIKARLLELGHSFRSESDSEVLIHGYEEWGAKILSKLNGMFAFAIYDKENQIIFLARDRLGIKPLHYYFDDNKFIFASELKSILAVDDLDFNISKKSLRLYFIFGFIPAPYTVFNEIKKMEPSCFIVFDLIEKKLQIKRYWDLKFQIDTRMNFDDASERILKLLDESVKLRMVSDVPIGAFLSGGIDSSLVVSSLCKFDKKPKTFTIGFEQKEIYDESTDAQNIAEHFCTDHFHLQMNSEDVLNTLFSLKDILDEPFAISSLFPQYLVAKIAREKVKVVLSGDGGDENFGGYWWYPTFMRLNKFRKIIPSILVPNLGTYSSNIVLKKIRSLHSVLKGDEIDLYYNLMTSQELRPILEENFPLWRRDYHRIISKFFLYESSLNNMFNCDLKFHLHNHILAKVDKATMMTSLEARVPFLDHRLVKFAATIPHNYKVKKDSKLVLKKAAMKRIPKENILKKKRGFSAPLMFYFQNELKSTIQETFGGKSPLCYNFINRESVDKVLKKFYFGNMGWYQPLFKLLQFELFLENWQHIIAT